MADEKKAVELTDEQAENAGGGLGLFGVKFDPDYCPKSPDHKHTYRTVVGVKSCLFCGGRPTK